MKRKLPQITLIGVDCVHLDKLKLAADICQKDFEFGAVKLLSSIPDADPRIVSIHDIKSTVAYSEFCIKELWKYVDTEYALIFQYDGFILNPSAWTDDFLKYDYIGAPWYHIGPVHIGNGGFSLRSKRLLDLIADSYKKIGGSLHPEDGWICHVARPFLEKNGMQFAPIDLASQFSKETNSRSVVWNGEFGFHGNYTDISKWLEIHPEYKDFFKQKFGVFTKIMQKYPVYDGTVHVLQNKPIQVANYKKLGMGKKFYDCRINNDLQHLDPILPGHIMVYRLFRIAEAKVGVFPFERKVVSIETFPSKKELLKKHPDIEITASFNLPKWKQRLQKVFGNMIFPNNSSYTIIWFEKAQQKTTLS